MNRKTALYTIAIIFLIVIIITVYKGVNEQFTDPTINNYKFYGNFDNLCKDCTYDTTNNTLSCVCKDTRNSKNTIRSSLKIDNIASGPIITSIGDKLALFNEQYKLFRHKSGKCLVVDNNTKSDYIWPWIKFRDCSGLGIESQFRFVGGGHIQNRTTGRYIHPYGSNAIDGNHLVLGDTQMSHPFIQLDGGSIQRKDTKLCIVPSSGNNNPDNNEAARLRSSCYIPTGFESSIFQN